MAAHQQLQPLNNSVQEAYAITRRILVANIVLDHKRNKHANARRIFDKLQYFYSFAYFAHNPNMSLENNVMLYAAFRSDMRKEFGIYI